MVKKILKIIFFLPVLIIIYQLVYILDGLINGTNAALLWPPNMIYGVDAMLHNWFWVGFLGLLYIPFLIYQIIYLVKTNNKFFKRIFIFEIVLIAILEFPLISELI